MSKKTILNKDIESNTRDIIKRYKDKGLNDAIYLLNEIEKIIKKGKIEMNLEKKNILFN